MQQHLHIKGLFLCLLLTSPMLSAKNTQYVSDELTIPMRSGTTTNHKILKFLNSGTAVGVIDQTDDQRYSHIVLIEDDTKTGWVETRLLMTQPSAREQLEIEKNKNQTLKGKQRELQQELAALKKLNGELLQVQVQLETNNTGVQNTLARLRKSAAEPIKIADENQQLKQQLSAEQSKNEALTKENAFLADQNIKQWFIIGAAVSIGSLILGLLITRINWKRKDSWAGSF